MKVKVSARRGKSAVVPVSLVPERRRWLPHAELVRRLAVSQADARLRQDLARLAGETTDDLGSLA
jgi:hypothetical protein